MRTIPIMLRPAKTQGLACRVVESHRSFIAEDESNRQCLAQCYMGPTLPLLPATAPVLAFDPLDAGLRLDIPETTPCNPWPEADHICG